MKITLYHRHLGVYDTCKTAEVPGPCTDWMHPGEPERGRRWNETLRIREDSLIAALPAGFLPAASERILLTVSDEAGGTGQSQLARFRPWAKYFDCYVLDLALDESAVELAAAYEGAKR